MAPNRLKAITLMFHDAVENNRSDDSGFSGLGPAIYKLDVHEMEAHFRRIAAGRYDQVPSRI